MNRIASAIRNLVEAAAPRLSAMPPDEVSARKGAGEWSKKEILGHLIDSAANNHQRIARAACGAAPVTLPGYEQNDWVRAQGYREADWAGLVAFWSAYNLHLGHIIERVPREALSTLCKIGDHAPVSLEFVIQDYLGHMEHHLKDLLQD